MRNLVVHALAAAAAALFVPQAAQAFGELRSEYAAQQTITRVGTLTRDVTVEAANADRVRAFRVVTQAGPMGQPVTSTVSANITLKGAARLAARALPYVAAGALAYELWDAYRVGHDPTNGLMWDPGQSTVEVSSFLYAVPSLGTGFVFTSHEEAGAHVWANRGSCGATCVTTRYVVTGSHGTPGNTQVFYRNNGGPEYLWFTRPHTAQAALIEQCPAIEGPGGAMIVPTIDWDGQCPTGNKTQPMSEQQAVDHAFQPGAPVMTAEQYRDILDEALGAAPAAGLRMPPSEEVTFDTSNPSPAQVPGGSVTTEGSTGAVRQDESFHGFGYEGVPGLARTAWRRDITTTELDSEGHPTSPPVVNIGDLPSYGGGGSEDPGSASDNPDPCASNPDRVGCQELGDPGDESPQVDERSVEFEFEDLGIGGACPAPHDLSVRGYAMALNYGPACDIAPFVRAGVLALTAFACMAFLIKESKA